MSSRNRFTTPSSPSPRLPLNTSIPFRPCNCDYTRLMQGHLTLTDAKACFAIYTANIQAVSKFYEKRFNELSGRERDMEGMKGKSKEEGRELRRVRMEFESLMDLMARECEAVEERFVRCFPQLRGWVK